MISVPFFSPYFLSYILLNLAVLAICTVTTALAATPNASDQCVLGFGMYNDNLRNNTQDSYFKINARIDAEGNISGGVLHLGYIGHSGGQNQLVGNAMFFCSNDINDLKIVGPYAGYGVTLGGYNHAIICNTPDGVPNVNTMAIENCSSATEVFDATLFGPGSNVKDTGTAPSGNRGFDDFNISVVFGENQFATSNGFVRDNQGFVYVGRCDASPVDPTSITIECQ